jgi:imidazolonepropionase
MIIADLVVSECNQHITCSGTIPKRRSALRNISVAEGSSIAARENQFVFIGSTKELEQKVALSADGLQIDASGYAGLPGFVNSHTHLPFAGSRANEFLLGLLGYTCIQLSEKGMGIQTVVNATKRASKKELVDLCLDRLDSMLLHGTTTAEAKNGSRLNLEDEIKQLEALQEANKRHTIDIVPTFLGAHEVPKEHKSRKEDYIDLLTHDILPRVIEKQLVVKDSQPVTH